MNKIEFWNFTTFISIFWGGRCLFTNLIIYNYWILTVDETTTVWTEHKRCPYSFNSFNRNEDMKQKRDKIVFRDFTSFISIFWGGSSLFNNLMIYSYWISNCWWNNKSVNRAQVLTLALHPFLRKWRHETKTGQNSILLLSYFQFHFPGGLGLFTNLMVYYYWISNCWRHNDSMNRA
jgi:hypothetical protein